MNTHFFNFIDRLVQLCCAKLNSSDKPPECQEAEDNGISVLSLNNNKSKEDVKE
jgi:hypothetical protein